MGEHEERWVQAFPRDAANKPMEIKSACDSSHRLTPPGGR